MTAARWRDRVRHFAAVDSTMQTARTEAKNGAPEGTTIIAQAQHGGRGRRGRTWESPAGAGLYATVILYPDRPHPQTLSLVAGVAVLEAVRGLGASSAMLKWPNDVVVDQRKLAGLLLEADLMADMAGAPANKPTVLVGIGINRLATATLSLSPEVARRHVGLGDLLAAAPSLEVIAATVLDALEARYAEWQAHGPAAALAIWRSADALRDTEVAVDGVRGLARGIDALGRLRIETSTGVVSVSGGEAM